MSESRISPHSLNDLKNTTDDALGNYLRGLSFKQDNTKLDFRLGVGYVAVLIAALTFAADYKLGWEATKGWTAVAVAAYSILNGVFTYWMWAIEKGLVFEGSKDGHKISVASKTKKHDPTYYLTITTTAPSSSRSSFQIKSPFTTWFTADGFFVAKPFQQWLATTVEMIGNADKNNAARDERDELAAPTPEVEVIGEGNETSQAGTSEAKNRGSKKPKRKG